MRLSITRQELHYTVYLFGLALVACCIPLSRYLLSIAQFLLALNWIIEGRYKEKGLTLIRKPAILLFASVFLVYSAGLIHTENLSMGMMKIKNALPLLLFPLIIGTSRPLPFKTLKWILLLFSVAVIVAAAICLINYLIHGIPAGGDFRSISIFMLHIRFSLMIVMAILILLYFSFFNNVELNRHEKIISFISACLLIAFLIFLRSITGIILFAVLAIVMVGNMGIRNHQKLIRYGLLLVVIGLFGTGIALVAYTYLQNFHAKPVVLSDLDPFTANGNRYSHDVRTGVLENGNYTDIYVCETEIKEEWNKISHVPYDSFDGKGQLINGTIKRYLASRGLRKDSAGIHRLSAADIQHIEKGLANYKFNVDPGVNQRLYESLWEIHIMINTGYVEQHSFGQRFAFLMAARNVFMNNIWTGTGTGDVYDSMLAVRANGVPVIDTSWEGKPHNQYVFFILAFGLPGFLWIAWCWLFPVASTKACRFFLFNLFAGIMLISMLTLDTLESYDSMVFFAFFYCLFVFGVRPRSENP